MDDSITGESESFSVSNNSFVPNGCIRCHPLHKEISEDCDAERVGVLDYMPLSRHTAFDVTQKTTPVALQCLQPNNRNSSPVELFDHTTPAPHSNEPKNIELKTFRITECGAKANFQDQRHLVPSSSCASDDDELLSAEVDDYLHEVVVQSSDSLGNEPEYSGGVISGIGCASLSDCEVSSILRCIPSSFGASRNADWPHPNTGCELPSVDNAEVVHQDSEAVACTTFRVSPRGCIATTTDRQDDATSGDQSLCDESSTTAVKDEKDPDVLLESSSLLPMEVMSTDRSSMDPSAISRSNVLYLNDYSLWTNAARAFCRDESVSDRSEVEKRQERRDKRKERRANERTVKAEDIEGYIGTKEVGDLVRYIIGDDYKVKKEMAKTIKKAKDPETGLMPLQKELSRSSEIPRKNPMQKWKVTSKASQKTLLNLPKMLNLDINVENDAGAGTPAVSTERTRSEEREQGGMVEQPKPLNGNEASALAEILGQVESDTTEKESSAYKKLGRTSAQSNNPEAEISQPAKELAAKFVSKTINGSTPKSASEADEPEQKPGSKKSKKQSKKNHNAQVTDKTPLESQDNSRVVSSMLPSLTSAKPPQQDISTEASLRISESGTPSSDRTTVTSQPLSESRLLPDAVNYDIFKSPSLQDTDDDWQVQTQKRPKNRARQGEGENWTFSQGEQHAPAVVWKDQPDMPMPSYKRPEGSGLLEKVGSISGRNSADGCQGRKFPHPLGRRGCQGSIVSSYSETSSSTSKAVSHTCWGGSDSTSKISNTLPRNSAKFLNQRFSIKDVQSKRTESATYAGIAAGVLDQPQCQSIKLEGEEKATLGHDISKPDASDQVPSQIGVEADLTAEKMQTYDLTYDPCTSARVEPFLGQQSYGGDISSKNDLSSSGMDLTLTSKEKLRCDTSMLSKPAEQVKNVTTSSSSMTSLSKELSRKDVSSVGDISSASKQDVHGVADQGLSDVSIAGASDGITETTERKTKDNKPSAGVTEAKTDAHSTDKDAARRKKSSQKTPSLLSGGRAKLGPVEFSKNFKSIRIDGISFGFDPTAVDKSQRFLAVSDCAASLIDDSSRSGGAISSCLVAGPSYSTTMVPAGGGLPQGSGTAVGNCSRPIAPLSGLGHTSGAKTPVVVVNPMQLARGPTQPSPTIVGNDTDPEMLKEVVVSTNAMRIEAATITSMATNRGVRMVNTGTSPVFSAKTDDIGGTMSVVAPERFPTTQTVACDNIPLKPCQPNESLVTTTRSSAVGVGSDYGKRVTFAEGPQEHQDDALVSQEAQRHGSSSERQLQPPESVQHRPDFVHHQPLQGSGLELDPRQHWLDPTHQQLSPGHRFQHEPRPSRPRESMLRQSSPNARLEVQQQGQQQFVYQPVTQPLMALGYIRQSQQGYILYSHPLLPGGGYPQGMGPVAVSPQQMMYQPQPIQGQHVVRPHVNAPPPAAAAAAASLLLNAMINYHAKEFQKVLEAEKNDPTKVVRYKED